MPNVQVHMQPGKTLPVFKLSSRGFADGATMPVRYTADGEDRSPPLSFSEPPPGTESFALICDDPDAPRGTFVHWVAWNIGAHVRELHENESRSPSPHGMRQGRNDFGREGWAGPSPPPGKPHRYVFRLLALDTRLDELANGASRSDLERALDGHVLGEAVLTGRYGR